MRVPAFATATLTLLIATALGRAALADERSGLYIAVNPAGFVQYISLTISNGTAQGFLEDVRLDAKSERGISLRQIALAGTASGDILTFGNWTVGASPHGLSVTYPLATGELYEGHFERTNVSDINAAVRTFASNAARLRAADADESERAEITRCLAAAAADAATIARLETSLAASDEKRAAAERAAAGAATAARLKHTAAETALSTARGSDALHVAAADVEAAMAADVVSARAQVSLTTSEADVAVTTDDLSVVRNRLASLQRRLTYLQSVLSKDRSATQSAEGLAYRPAARNVATQANAGLVLDP